VDAAHAFTLAVHHTLIISQHFCILTLSAPPCACVTNKLTHSQHIKILTDALCRYTFPRNFVGTIRVNALSSAVTGSQLTMQLGEWLADASPSPPAPPSVPSHCNHVDENVIAFLGGCAPGGTISSVEFASYGEPTGDCTSGFKIDTKCNSANSVDHVTKM
jgi:hypothetical protein